MCLLTFTWLEAVIVIETRQDSSIGDEDLSKETVIPFSGWKEKLMNFWLSYLRTYLKNTKTCSDS